MQKSFPQFLFSIQLKIWKSLKKIWKTFFEKIQKVLKNGQRNETLIIQES